MTRNGGEVRGKRSGHNSSESDPWTVGDEALISIRSLESRAGEAVRQRELEQPCQARSIIISKSACVHEVVLGGTATMVVELKR